MPDLDTMRRQYLETKKRYPHAIVFFRVGDFYETFDDDAKLCARELEVTLTLKPIGPGPRVPVAGFPHHGLDHYLYRLVTRGYKVAICEQIEDPATVPAIVQRDVVRLPGFDGPLPGKVAKAGPARLPGF